MKINIGNYTVGENRIFVIAEIGNNHNGSYERALEMIDLAIEMGADCVKFQMRHLNQVYRHRSLEKNGEDLGTEYVIDLLKKFELSVSEHRKLSQYCESKDILYMCTPWDAKSVEVLENFPVSAYKVASADLTNLPLIECLCNTKKPLIFSTGMSLRSEVQKTVDLLNKRNSEYVLLHCNSTYPAPFQDINLRWMNSLSQIHSLVGYSGHERGIAVSLAAAALGACVIERHFTLDRKMEGPDHAASLEYAEFKRLIDGIREIEQSLGDGRERVLSQGEMINRENLAKSLVASSDLSVGTILSAEDIKVCSPGQGLSPQYYSELLGKTLSRKISKEDFFFPSDLKSHRIEPRAYKFKRPWGVPVRYHDFKEYESRIKPDIFEFHLSYSDMEIDPADYLSGNYSYQFIVHAPELFEGSHLLDLASPDEVYRRNSCAEMQRVINITRNLKQFFPNTKRPMIVANIGGFSMDAPIEELQKNAYYERFFGSLKQLDLAGVELIPQTMAPFPWHFGGQRYQNIFVLPEEILYWCNKYQMRICFDISHSALMCNHFKLNFYDFAKAIGPFSAHLHLGDASGVNGEGLQIGSGEIDFARLAAILDSECPTSPFIPEIWQGHKNGGEGFWIALEKLEASL